MQRPPKFRRICMGKTTLANQSPLNGFPYKSLQYFEIFKLSWNISLSITWLKSPFFSWEAIWGVMNGPLNFLTVRIILPLLDLLAKFKRLLACSCSQNFCSCSHARFLVSIERKSKTDLQGLPPWFFGCVALSNAFKLHFCPFKHLFQRFISFVGYDRRSFKNCFQQRMNFYKAPICHQCLFRILYRSVISCNERQ